MNDSDGNSYIDSRCHLKLETMEMDISYIFSTAPDKKKKKQRVVKLLRKGWQSVNRAWDSVYNRLPFQNGNLCLYMYIICYEIYETCRFKDFLVPVSCVYISHSFYV